jgi:hypothetical protein
MAVFDGILWIGQAGGELQSCDSTGACTSHGDKGEHINSMTVFNGGLWIGQELGTLQVCDSEGNCSSYGDGGSSIRSMVVFNPASLGSAIYTSRGDTGIGTNAPETRLHVRRSVSGGASMGNHVTAIENTSTGESPDVLMLKVNVENPDNAMNFITFADSSGNLGSIEGDNAGGISFNSSGGDFAEYLPKLDSGEKIAPGDIVGLFGRGVSKQTEASIRLLVVSTAPIILGNRPDRSVADKYVPVAFVGQVPVKVSGPVKAGDYIVASDRADGVGYAVSPGRITSEHFSLIVGCALEDSSDADLKLIKALVGVPLERSLAETLKAKENRIARLESKLAELESVIDAHFTADRLDARWAFNQSP